MTRRQILFVALVMFFACSTALNAGSGELLRLSRMVNDFASFLQPDYARNLEARLRRFNERSDYAIVVVIIPDAGGVGISDFISQLFVANEFGAMRFGRNGSHFDHGERRLGHSEAESKNRKKFFASKERCRGSVVLAITRCVIARMQLNDELRWYWRY
jgi:hypothetical protein